MSRRKDTNMSLDAEPDRIDIFVESLPYICTKCDISFGEEHDLLKHVLTNHNGINYCFRCNKIFSDRNTLESHNRRYHEKRHVCIFCPKAYEGLKYHMRKHGKNKYQCKHCHKLFYASKELYNHLRIHIKPFKCFTCKAEFDTKRSLRRHLIQQHLEKPCCWLPSLENAIHFKKFKVASLNYSRLRGNKNK